MKWRRRLSGSDLSMEDRHARKHVKHRPKDPDGHSMSGSNMAARASDHYDHHQMSLHRYQGDVEPDAYEALARTKSSQRRSHPEDKAAIHRQLKEIERIQRKVAPSDLSSEQEIHVHYVPIISNSPSNPFHLHHQSGSLSSTHEDHKPKYRANKNKDKRSMAAHTSRDERSRSPQDRSRNHSSRRSKHGHEKHGKHGKRVDPYLEPLKQRWICYECGKIRSDKIRERHPLAVDQKMQPNWCGRCRITHECEGKPLAWYGQRHYCWGCGIVRSEKYHRENELEPGQPSGPNYCRPCREASPSYEHNLREASEVGGEATGFEKAFMRQMHDASLSDIEEDKDDCASAPKRAPGKENDARRGPLKSREATSSMLKNRSFKTKTSSDTSSDGNMTIEKLKHMHLEADQKLNFGGKAEDGGARLSAGSSYKPPSVESVSGDSVVGGDVKTSHSSRCEVRHLAQDGGNGDCEMEDAGSDTADKACQADISSTFQALPNGPDRVVSPLQAQTSDSGSRPTTGGTTDSGASRTFPSGASRTPAASIRFRARRNPAETSTGSPPERDGLAAEENIGDKLRSKDLGSGPWAQYPAQNGAQGLPLRGTSESAPHCSGVTGGFAYGRGMSGFPKPPTPPRESPWPYVHQQDVEPDRNMMNRREWAAPSSPPPVPMSYGHSMSPVNPDCYAAHHGDGGSGSSSGAEYPTQPGYFSHPHGGFSSAAHFSDAHCHRDFSGDSYCDDTNAQQFEHNKPSYPCGSFAQTQQGYQHGQQHEHDPRSQYRPQAQYCPRPQYGFQSEPGSWPEYRGSGLSQQHPDFGDDSGCSAPKDFDFSFIGQCKGGWAANTYVPTNEEINAYMEQNFADPGPQTTNVPRTDPQWKIYEDESDAAALEQQGCDAYPGAYAWRDDKTSVHHVSSSNPGNTVTILSIREITSDEELSANYDGSRRDDDDHNGDAFSSLTALQTG